MIMTGELTNLGPNWPLLTRCLSFVSLSLFEGYKTLTRRGNHKQNFYFLYNVKYLRYKIPRCTNQNFILMTSPPPPKLKQKKIPATSQSTKIWKYNTFFNSGYVWLEGVWMVYFSNYPYFTFITGKAFFLIYLFIYLFIFGCVGSSFLCKGFL